MRILLVTNLYPPQELGGYGRSLADFCWGLQQRGHSIKVLCSDAPYLGASAAGPSGEPVLRELLLKGTFEGGVELLQEPERCRQIDQHNSHVVTRLCGAQPFDGILLGNLDLLGVELLTPLLQLGLPLLHHVGFMVAPFAPGQWPNHPRYTLVAASQAVRGALLQAGLPVANAAVVYPGARTELFGVEATGRRLPPATPPAGQRLGSRAYPLKLCFAGLLMGSKGVHTLVDAAVQLHQQGVALQLTLAGADFQPGYWEALQQLAQAGGFDAMQWVGSLGRPQLARCLGLHHAGVFPSIFPEAFGIVGAEIQASGLALVSSGVGGAAELLSDGIDGLRFEPGNAADLCRQLRRLVDEPGLLARLQAAGQQRVRRQFSVTAAAQQLEALWLQSR